MTMDYAEQERDMASKAIERITGVPPMVTYALPNRSKPIYPPAGVKRNEFDAVVEAAILYHSLSSGEPLSAKELKPYIPYRINPDRVMTLDFISKVMTSQSFHATMILRGVESNADGTLTAVQMRALSVVLDPTSNTTFERKLKKAGVTSYQWTSWLNDPLFRAHHDKIASTLFDKFQAAVDSQVVSGSLDGKLDFIKYFNELSGKNDPKKRSQQDIQQLLNDVVEIVTRNVKDRDTLMQISAELSMVVAKLG